MPEITSNHIGIAADMFGCPNRCRHCYLGHSPNGTMTEDDVRRAANAFRALTRPGEGVPLFQSIDVVTWHREPDFSDEYRRVYELEIELSDVKTYRAEWELMSEWRIARDETYAPWAYGIGLRTCQTTFFGVGETQDWFYQRRGAYDDCILATERLLEAGIKPRWQFFFTRKIIPEFDELMRLVDRMKIRERCSELGGEFVMFIHTPGPSGEAEFIEDLRPTIDDVKAIPVDLIQATERHFGERLSWTSVGERVSQLLASAGDEHASVLSATDPLWFIVKPNWDVFSNTGTMEPWWRLGNLQTDSIGQIVANYEQNNTVALRTICNVPLRELAVLYGDKDSRLIDGGVEDLWLARYCREQWESAYVGC